MLDVQRQLFFQEEILGGELALRSYRCGDQPAQVIGDLDGQWDRNAYKTDAFFGNPLSGFVAP